MAVRRPVVNWSQPEPWTIALVLATGLVVIGRHPLAQMIGTESSDGVGAPAVVATAPSIPGATPAAPATGTSAVAGTAGLPAVVPHTPRDPFHALGKVNASALAPDTPAAVPTRTHDAAAGHGASATRGAAATGATSCAGTVHTVVAGDSLWTIAARTVRSNDTATVAVAWHRLYRVNRPPLGPDPSLLPVGAKICVPSTL